MPEIIVMPRTGAVRYCHKQHDTESIMISISTPLSPYDNAPFTSPTNKIKGILRLYFTDTDGGEDSMTPDDAKAICEFVTRHANIPNIIVHCDAGQSRSAGVAAALLKCFTGDDSQIFNNPYYKPNRHCYRLVLNELMTKE